MLFLINLLNGIAERLPELIQAAVNVIAAFFSGIIDALAGLDTSVLVKTIAGIGLLSGIMVALGAVAALIPSAMAGVLGMGVLIAELAVVLAAVGALAQIPGLSWLIGEGGKLLEQIGMAIGGFVGGIVGGFMSGISSQFPQIRKRPCVVHDKCSAVYRRCEQYFSGDVQRCAGIDRCDIAC